MSGSSSAATRLATIAPISSRKGANGPTLGDTRGRSVLDGTGLYATAFRAARWL